MKDGMDADEEFEALLDKNPYQMQQELADSLNVALATFPDLSKQGERFKSARKFGIRRISDGAK